MNKILNAAALISALIVSPSVFAQDVSGSSSKSAVVVELEAPDFEDVKRGRAGNDQSYYQLGNKRTSSQRSADATKFCNSIRYTFGLALEYKSVPSGDVDFDYLKRVICFE